MKAFRQGLRHLHETWDLTRDGLIRHHANLGERLSLGIIPRLVMFFVGVGGLVLATNFVVEHGVLIERTTQITPSRRPRSLNRRPSRPRPKNGWSPLRRCR